jgi:hypothetical protein
MMPGADNLTRPPLPLLLEVSIVPFTVMLPGDDGAPDEVKDVPPCSAGTLGEFANVVKPACKIKAGSFFKI